MLTSFLNSFIRLRSVLRSKEHTVEAAQSNKPVESKLKCPRNKEKDNETDSSPQTVKKPRKSRAKNSITFSDTVKKESEKTVGRRADSTIINYRTAVNSFRSFLHGDDIPLSALTNEKVLFFREHLIDKGISENTASCYIRSLRSLYKKYYENKSKNSVFPFSGVPLGNYRTVKRPISMEEMKSIKDLDLKEGTPVYFVRDLLLFSFSACGMPMIDMAFLEKSNIRDGKIIYNRHKTGQTVVIKVLPIMQMIIDRYSAQDSKYVFPILSRMSRYGKPRKYSSILCRYNYYLRKLGEDAGVSIRLSSYVARHTWATMAFSIGIDINVISRALGHTSTRTTMIYINSIEDKKVFDACEGVAFSFPLP
jgi:integrase/recombinase XerD